MKRFAAHFVFVPTKKICKLHWIETDDNSHVTSLLPLEKEIASTVFYDGILLIVNEDSDLSASDLEQNLASLSQTFPQLSLHELLPHLALPETALNKPVKVFNVSSQRCCQLL